MTTTKPASEFKPGDIVATPTGKREWKVLSTDEKGHLITSMYERGLVVRTHEPAMRTWNPNQVNLVERTEAPRRNALQEHYNLGVLQLEDGNWRVTNGMHATAWMPTKEQARSRWDQAYGAVHGHVHQWVQQGNAGNGQRHVKCHDCGNEGTAQEQ